MGLADYIDPDVMHPNLASYRYLHFSPNLEPKIMSNGQHQNDKNNYEG